VPGVDGQRCWAQLNRRSVGRRNVTYRSPVAMLVVLLSLTCMGCVAYHEPFVASGKMVAEPPTALATVHVRVRRPEIDDPLPAEKQHWEGLAPADILEWWTDNADHVIETLSDTKLFASVSYSTASPDERSVVLRPVFPPPGPYCDGQDILLPFMTLGIFPAACERDRGVYFQAVGRRLPNFSCRWPQTEMVGWFPVLLATGFGSWTKHVNGEAFIAHVRSCIASQAEVFEPTVAP